MLKKLLSLLIILNLVILYPVVSFAQSSNPKSVYIGGDLLEFKMEFQYPMIFKTDSPNSKFQLNDKIMSFEFKNGDIKAIKSEDQYYDLLSNYKEDKSIKVKILRSGNVCYVKTKKDVLSKLLVNDKATALSTLTYVDTVGTFGSMAYPIDPTSSQIALKKCLVSTTKDAVIEKSAPGSLGYIKDYSIVNKIGKVSKNNIFGVTGEIDNINDFCKDRQKYEVARFDDIEVGDAYIVIRNTSGELKNIKINILMAENESNYIKFLITDKDFVNEFGGVTFGLNGAPIIQNNKLIGAVSTALPKEPRFGHAIYINNMLSE